jgi:hypothetical protein
MVQHWVLLNLIVTEEANALVVIGPWKGLLFTIKLGKHREVDVPEVTLMSKV